MSVAVDALDALDAHERTLRLADGRVVAYEAVLLATGGAARRLAVPGADHARVVGLRTLDDAAAIVPHLAEGAHLVVVGGGFIGLEVAASARSRGVRVTLLEGAPRLLGRAVPAVLAERVRALHEAHGVTIRLGSVPAAFEPAASGALTVVLDDGERLAADLVVVGIGIEPSDAIAREAGLAVQRGIVVDARLEASVPRVFAAGDVAVFPSVLSGQPVRQETWHNAETQARVAAANMLGAREPYRALPWFWSDQYDHQLQVAGEPALGVRTVVRPLGEAAELRFDLDADGRLVAASGFGPLAALAREMKLARMLVERDARVAEAELADPAVKLKALLPREALA